MINYFQLRGPMKQLILLLALFFQLSLYSEDTPWTIADTDKLKLIGNSTLSPDGNFLFCTVFQNKETLSNDLFVYDCKLKKWSLFAKNTHQPQWSPDGQWISFIRESKLWIIPFQGGEALEVTDGNSVIETYAWSPTSQQIAFVIEEKTSEEQSMDVWVSSQIVPGSHLWVATLNQDSEVYFELNQITQQSFFLNQWMYSNKNSLSWHPDGKLIALALLTPSDHPIDNTYYISLVNIETQEMVPLTENSTTVTTDIYFSPDGNWLACCATDGHFHLWGSSSLHIIPSQGGAFKPLALTPNEALLDTGKIIGWSHDSQSIYVLDDERTQSKIYSIPIDGREAIALDLDVKVIWHARLNSSKTSLSFVADSLYEPAEVYTTSLSNICAEKISSFNQSLLQDKQLPKTELIHWTSKDNLGIEGLLTYPLNYVPGVQYPLILVVHGGPCGISNQSFIGCTLEPEPIALLSSQGYLVLRCNMRGSTGYGKSFRASNRGDLGGLDYEDLITGIDHLIGLGVADSDRLGITGWSYGGYMAAFAITHTDRFKVAVMGAGVSSFLSFAHFAEDYFEGEIHEKLSLFLDRSPITRVDKIKTPLLIVHGAQDYVVPYQQSTDLFYALKRRKCVVELITYPYCGHSPGWSSTCLKDFQERTVDWFNKYLNPSIKPTLTEEITNASN